MTPDHRSRGASPVPGSRPFEGGVPVGQDHSVFSLTASPGLPRFLAAQRVSLAFTTYQAGRLFTVGLSPDGGLSVFQRSFERCMGLWAAPDGQSFWMATQWQLWRFANALAPGAAHEGYDRPSAGRGMPQQPQRDGAFAPSPMFIPSPTVGTTPPPRRKPRRSGENVSDGAKAPVRPFAGMVVPSVRERQSGRPAGLRCARPFGLANLDAACCTIVMPPSQGSTHAIGTH